MKYFAIIPAAGTGTRMQAETPKQYLTLLGKSILELAAESLLHHPQIEKLVIVLKENDSFFKTLPLQAHPKIITATGGNERFHTVLNGLNSLLPFADQNDWILIHDAARPCLQRSDIDKLITVLDNHPTGGILGVSIRDTIKRVIENKISETIDRNELWHAYTPQMFRFGLLHDAITSALEKNQHITDDAMAIELMGLQPLMIEGRRDNIKITQQSDLALAEFYLRSLTR
jgi:2-C-methyl-D-erythritol 4-phosphate cytidylyltransferase